MTASINVVKCDYAERSDVGQVRTLNEDSVLCLPKSGLWLVSDGMGGHAAGDFASQTITAELESVGVPVSLEDLQARFMARLSVANTRIVEKARASAGGTIGATLAAVLIQGDRFACIWSGDSRVYRFRNGDLTRLSRDHTEVQALLDAGSISEDQARSWPRKNVITRAIGVTPVPECDVVEGALGPRDVFLICSDGLTEYFEDAEIASVLASAGPEPLSVICDDFVDQANARGGKDNISVVILRCQVQPPEMLTPVWAFPEFEGTL